MRMLFGLSHEVLRLYHLHQFPVLFVLLVIEEAGIPIPVPGDMLIMAAGARANRTLSYSLATLAVTSTAVIIGSSVLYYVMRTKGRDLLTRYGRFLHVSESRLSRVERWFQRRGRIAIIVGRLIPGLRIPTTVMAGLANVSYPEYLATSTIAAIIWSSGYFWLGAAIRTEWRFVTGLTSGLLDDLGDWLTLGAIVAVLIVIAVTVFARRSRREVGRAPSSTGKVSL